MEKKLFPNIKKMTTFFGIAILSLTVGILLLRLTVFSKVSTEESTADDPSSIATEDLAIDFTLSEEIVFENAKASSSIKIRSAKNDAEKISIKLINREDKKYIYESSPISLGNKTVNVKLNNGDLPAGEYDCLAEITRYNSKTQEKIGTFERSVKVIVQGDVPEEIDSIPESVSA